MSKPKFILLSVLSLLVNIAFASPDTIQQKIDYYISQAEFDSAKIYIQTNLDDINQQPNLSSLNYQLVKVLFIQSDYNEALKKAFYALDKIDNNKEESVKFNFMIACIYSAIKDYNKSLEYFDLVVMDSKDSSIMVKAHLLSSELHLELRDSMNARKALTSAYRITSRSKSESKIKNHVAIQYNFFSQNYELCKQQNLKIIEDTTSFLNAKSYAYSMVGDCLIKQDSLLEATKYLDEFLKLTFKTNDPEQVKIAAKKLIEVYEKLGIQEKANTYHKIYNEAVNDSLSFSIEKYRALYNVEKNRELDTVKAKNSRNYLLFGLSLVLIFSFGIYYFYKNNKIEKEPSNLPGKTPRKKIIISDIEIEKIKTAIDQLINKQLFLTPKITRKSFCFDHKIKSERYLSHYINTEFKTSFTIFINDLRIEYAYHRLQNDPKFRNYRIEEIAKESGFGSKKSFERVFLAKYNETPYKFILKVTD
ncbi:MAG: helix-turn-helix domain-containing protein [Saprospiraceae bacterium]